MTKSADSQQKISENGAKRGLLWVAAVRIVARLVAIPLFPLLYRHHFLVLVLLRPTPGVLVAGGFLARLGHVGLLELLAAAVPLRVVAVWLDFGLGRAWAKEIDREDELPFVAARVLNRDQVQRLRDVLGDKGAWLAFAGRFALFPTGLLSAAVGASEEAPKSYLLADGAGAVVSTAAAVGAGYVLGMAQDSAGPWLVAAGVIGLGVLAGALTWLLQDD